MIAEATQLRLAATLAIVGFVWWVVTTVALQILAAGANDPVEQSISELALGRFGTFMDVAFFAFGIGSLALAFGLYRSVYDALVAPLLLAVAGVLWFLLGVFQTGSGYRSRDTRQRRVGVLPAHPGRNVPLRPAVPG